MDDTARADARPSGTDDRARTRLYRGGRLEKEDFPVEEVSDHLRDPEAVVWVDLLTPRPDDLAFVANELGLHHLAVADAMDTRERPKVDRYSTHDFLNVYSVRLDPGSGAMVLSELSAFITDRALVTVRKSGSFDIDAVVARWDESPDLAQHGVGFLLYGLLDYVVDTHFEAVQDLDDGIEELEDLLFGQAPADTEVQRRSFTLRKSLVTLRRVVLPMREVVNTLMRRDCTWRRPTCTRTTRTSTTTYSVRPSGPSRCATSSRRSSRRS